jgi:hypothetical protein
MKRADSAALFVLGKIMGAAGERFQCGPGIRSAVWR